MNAQSYLQKHSFFDELVVGLPDKETCLCIIIPAYNEPKLFVTLESVFAMKSLPGVTEVLVVLNHSVSSSEEIKNFHANQYQELLKIQETTKTSRIRLIAMQVIELPEKWAGVGMARKIGMDEAIRRFSKIGKEGILCNIDADCFVNSDYLIEVGLHFEMNPSVEALSFGFVHHTIDCDFLEKQAITFYELHLRLYLNWQKYFKYPFAYHTLGSCFGVRTDAYRQQGGMNRRKAGEDFYFLHKFSVIDKLAAVDKVLVFPSGRISDRVPFGTGKSVAQIIENAYNAESFESYHPEAIGIFCNGLQLLSLSYFKLKSQADAWKQSNLDPSLIDFLVTRNFQEHLDEIVKNCNNVKSFEKRLSRYFDPFLLMKFLHFTEANIKSRIAVMDSFKRFMKCYQPENIDVESCSVQQALDCMRAKDYGSFKPGVER
ncbi:MAG: glycosyltransferase [Saprospiraceae bacterium]|nr:glycosyltransferase [Saprospiraceae bacterium]